MSLATQVSALATRVGAAIKSLTADVGDKAALTTTAKGNLVAAINEVKAGALAASQKGAAGGVASLDGNGKVPANQIPATAIVDTFVVASQAAMLALNAAEVGDIAIRTDLNKTFILKTTGYATLANWQELLTPTQAVSSVNGKTGAITLVVGDIAGLQAALDVSATRTDMGDAATDFVASFNAALT
jgi:hypothetical protein